VAALLLAATSASAEGKLHVVQPGESLATIAERQLGDRALWPLLYKANRDRIKDPARIYPGQELSIPEPAAEPGRPAVGAAPEDDE
jgi:nucleoid-associated protein YgaU